MAAAPMRFSPVPDSLVHGSFPFAFAFSVYLSSSPISLARWSLPVTAALGSARNHHSAVQVRRDAFLPSFDRLAILAFHRLLLFRVQSVCDSLQLLRFLESVLSQECYALFPV
jgi:hypothetical protein